MALLAPGVAQGINAGMQDQRELEAARQQASLRKAQIDWQNLQIEQARQEQARQNQMRQAAGQALGAMMAPPPPMQQQQAPAVPPGQSSQPQAPGMIGWPQAPQGTPPQPQPYQTVQSASRPPMGAPAPSGPPPVQQQPGGTLQRVLASLKAAGVPQEQWGDAILQMKAPIGMMESDELNQLKMEIAQVKAKQQADAEAGRDRRFLESQQGMMDRLLQRDRDAAARKGMGSGGGAGSYSTMSPEMRQTVDYYAQRALSGDNTWRTGLGRSAKGSGLILAVEERIPQLAQQQGQSPEDAIARGADVKAKSSALAQNTKDLAAIRPFNSMLDKNADILTGLADKVIKSNSQFANKSLNWLAQNAGDNPDTAEYLAQMHFVQTEAARVLSNPRLVGPLTDTAKAELNSVVNGNMPLNATKRVIARIKSDGANRVKAMEEENSALKKDLSSPVGKASNQTVHWDDLK